MGMFSSKPKKKNTLSARVAKLRKKVEKADKIAKLKAEEQRLKKKLGR